MSAEEADKTATTDASGGDEEEEWLYGGKKKKRYKDTFYETRLLRLVSRDRYEMVHDCKPSQWTTGSVAAWC